MHDHDSGSRKSFCGISALWCRAESFYLRNKRLNSNRADMFADWIKEHVVEKYACFEQLMEADGVLCLASLLKSHSFTWYPRTYVYGEWGNRTAELFDAARDVQYAKRLLVIFGESDLETLKTKVQNIAGKWRATYGDVVHYFLSSLNVDKWGTLK